MRFAAAVSALIVLGGAPAGAQTDDVLFGGWSWRPRDHGSRPAGLGGAYVAVADSVRTADVNPAGLALVPRAEAAVGTADRWAGLAYRLRPSAEGPVERPTEAGAPLVCPGGRRARPLALALFAEQAVEQNNEVDVVRGPGLGERGALSASTEEIGGSLAKGLTPWLDLGVTVAWRHLRMEGRTATVDGQGSERERLSVAGDANKARVLVGALATFGRSWDPTAFRIGVAYRRDLTSWSVERSRIDLARGVVSSAPALVRIEEPPVLSAGLAWRASETWLVSGQVDYIWYDRVARSLARNGATTPRLSLANGVEPRLGIEMTRPSRIGGYYKLRAGAWRETSGRLAAEDADFALEQAFPAGRPAFRAAVGISFLAEFYANAARFDFDVSQVVVERQSTIAAAGSRRYSLSVTVRM